jgi:hypothetical protein
LSLSLKGRNTAFTGYCDFFLPLRFAIMILDTNGCALGSKGRAIGHCSCYCRRDFFCRSIVLESNCFALSSSARRSELRPRPARFMKYVSIRMPEPAPFGEMFFEAKVLAIVRALFVNNPGGGWVESVFTFATPELF